METYLFIDGTNLYAAQYELFGPKKHLDFSKFIKEVEKKIETKFNRIYFYASYSPKSKRPAKKEKLYLKNEALFYKSVRRTKNVIFFRGYRSKTSGKEKEVDVKLAVDLVHFAHLQKYDSAYLLTGDADFLQALWTIKPLVKNIRVLSFQNKILYKAVYFFPLYVVCFDGKPELNLKRFYGYKVLILDSRKMLGGIK